jgi:hypothetical protein
MADQGVPPDAPPETTRIHTKSPENSAESQVGDICNQGNLQSDIARYGNDKECRLLTIKGLGYRSPAYRETKQLVAEIEAALGGFRTAYGILPLPTGRVAELCDERFSTFAFPPSIRPRPIRSATCARSPPAWAARSSRSTRTTAYRAPRVAMGALRSMRCAAMRQFDVIILVGGSPRPQSARLGRLPIRNPRLGHRPLPTPAGPRHHDAGGQGDVSDDGRIRRVRARARNESVRA